MTTYTVNSSNWNDPGFWATVNLSSGTHTIDFSTLPSNFTVYPVTNDGMVYITDGTNWYSIGDSTATGTPDTTLGGGSLWSRVTRWDGTDGNDAIYYGTGNNTVFGGDGNDTIDDINGTVHTGNDYIDGEGGDDLIYGGGGADTIYGGLGNDLIAGEDGNDSIEGMDGNDTITGAAGADYIIGGEGDDSIDGGTGNDTIADSFSTATMGTASHQLRVGDTLYRGEAFYAPDGETGIAITWNGNVVYFHDTNSDGVLEISNLFGVAVSGVDRLVIQGGDLVALNEAGGTVINAGATTAAYLTAQDDGNVVLYTASDVALGDTGTWGVHGASVVQVSGNDTIRAGDGDDFVNAGDGADVIYGGIGNDEIEGGAGNDTVFVEASFGNDTVDGGDGTDVLDFTALSTPLTVSYTGADQGTITDGVSTVTFSSIEELQLSQGNDTVSGFFGSNDVTIYGNGGNDSINTGSGADVLYGGDGNDTLLSGGGSDTLYGGAGDDWLDGQLGSASYLDGGTGNDTFVIADDHGNETVVGGDEGGDLDLLDFQNWAGSSAATLTASGDEAGTFTFGTTSGTYSQVETMSMSAYADSLDLTLDGSGLSITLEGGNDSVTVGTGDDSISGGAGQDSFAIIDSFGNDTIDGGSAGTDSDTLDFSALTGGISATFITAESGTATQGANSLGFTEIENYSWSGGNDTVNVSALSSGVNMLLLGGDDSFIASSGNDTVDLGAGDDTFVASAGADSITGDTGLDIVDYSASTEAINVDLRLGTGFVGGLAANDTHSGVDGIIGTDFNDTLIGFDQQGFDPGEEYTNVLYGGDGNDLIQGNGGGDSLYGEAGADTIEGGTGNDVIEGGAGTDSISGGDDADTIDGGTENDTIYGDAGDDSIRGGAGADTLYGGAGVDSIYGDAGADLINLDGGTSGYADGGDDADTLIVADDHTSETLIGGEGGTDQDVLQFINWGGTSGATVTATGDEAGTLTFGTTSATYSQIEEMVLTGYTDVLDLSLDDSGLTLDLGADGDQATLGDGNDTVDGGAGDDTIVGGAGDDSLLAGTGGTHDYLEGGLGADTLIGTGSNWAIIRYGSSASGVDIDLSDGLAESGGEAQGDVLTDIDQIDATSFNDTITTTAGTIVLGFDGDDSLTVASGGATLLGMAGDDTLTGSSGADNLSGGDNDDLILGGAGADTLAGDGGDDTFAVADGFGNDTITGGETGETNGDLIDLSGLTGPVTITYATGESGTIVSGSDTITFSEIEQILGSDLADTIDAAASTSGVDVDAAGGADTITGSGLADQISGGAGQDTIFGGAGTDTLAGGDDRDLFRLADGFGNDTITGGEGAGSSQDADTIDGSALTGNITVTFAGDENGTLTDGTDTVGFSEIENVFTGGGNDTVNASASTGGVGIFTYAGADSILGSSGADYIEAGDGEDTIVIQDGFGNDTIDGGSGGTDSDTLDLTGLTGPVTVTFTGAESGTVVSGADTISFSDIETVLYSDYADTIDGSGAGASISVTGSDGADTIDGSASADSLDGGDGNDTIVGGVGNDTLIGGLGADSLSGGDDNDQITAGAGADELDGGAGADTLLGGAGADTLLGGLGADSIDGGDDADTIVLADNFGADTIDGGGLGVDSDTLDLTALTSGVTVTFSDAETGTVTSGAQTASFSDIEALSFSDQNDSVDGTSSTQAMSLNAAGGSDTIDGSAQADSLAGGDGGDSISGNDGADTIDGGAGNDTLTGGAGADSVDGGAGNDSITAGEGDTVDGGDGDDTVLVSRDDLSGGTLTVRGGEGAETGGDTLQIIGPATINYTDAESGTATFLDGSVLAFSEFETVQYTACFTDGILMRTARGSVPIEDVRLGDMVLTRDNGFQPVRWAGGRHFSFRDLREHPHLAPIRLKTGSLGAGNPSQDMLLSPQHKVLLTGAQAALWFGEPEVLVAAKDLVKVPGISQVTPRQGVTYRHILFDRHEIVLGDNLWSESFQPGAQTIGALDEAARQELYEIFPELALPEASGHFPAARMVLRASQAQAFVRAFYVPSRKAG